MNHLSQSEIVLFYKLWFGLVGGINEKHKVIPHFLVPQNGTGIEIDVREFVKVRNAMWDNPEWIDEFLADHDDGEYTELERGIIMGWRKRFVKDQFVVMCHLSDYSVFMPFDDKAERLYAVRGVIDPVADNPGLPVPYLADYVLIPFKDKIIYDSIALPYNISFGPGIYSTIKNKYIGIKSKYEMIEVLDGREPVPKRPAKAAKKAAAPDAAGRPRPDGVPRAMVEKYNEIADIIKKFSGERLNGEYEALCLAALAKLCRKRPSPLLRGRARAWACGIVYAIGQCNFIFDKSMPIHMTALELAGWFGVTSGTADTKAAEIAELLHIGDFDEAYCLESVLDKRPW
ncbi:MAG: DUF6398 domain-containing protein [Clostridiales bacterium]|jgi:hypothetical protein|nr:DUF6398 domain-containing protein [Clostridiales bacterium]